MLGFFRINVADRILYLALLLVAMTIPALLWSIPPTIPEEIGIQVGHRLGSGHWLYEEIKTDVGPIPALIYALLDWTGASREWLVRLAAMFLLLIQVWSFNAVALRYEIFPEKNYVPGLLYLALCMSCFDYWTLSPISIGISFSNIALLRVMKHMRLPVSEDEMLYMGSLIAMASLCYQPLGLFLLVPLGAFVLYTGTSLRQYLLLILGFTIPLLLVGIMFYLAGYYLSFYENFFGSITHLEVEYWVSEQGIILYALVPLLFLIGAALQVSGSRRFINYQITVQVSMFITLVTGVLIWLIARERSLAMLGVFHLPTAFFITNLLYILKKRWLAEVLTLIWVIAMPLSNAVVMSGLSQLVTRPEKATWLAGLDDLFIRPKSLPTNASRILVLGKDYHWYHGRYLSTPYLNYDLSVRDLQNLDDYRMVLEIYNHFNEEWPEIIIAPTPTLRQLFDRMPALRRHYAPMNGQQHIYQFVQ